MRLLTTEERRLYNSSAVLSNVVHVCVMALGRISNTVPQEIDGVAYTAENLAELVASAAVSKLQESGNVK